MREGREKEKQYTKKKMKKGVEMPKAMPCDDFRAVEYSKCTVAVHSSDNGRGVYTNNGMLAMLTQGTALTICR